MKNPLPLIFVLLLSVFGALPAAADPGAIASVVAVRGQVTATNQAGVARTLMVKDPLFVEDTLRTGKEGRIQLLFNDATIISLARETEMKLATYQWDAKAKTGEMKTQVKEGTFRVMGGALTQFAPKNFTTETPTATIGIRGSMYAGRATANSLTVVFHGGRGIDVTNAAGTVALTRPGFGTHVTGRDQPPSPPTKFSAAELGAINEALTGSPKAEDKPKAQGEQSDSTAPGQDDSGNAQGTDGAGGGDGAFSDPGATDMSGDAVAAPGPPAAFSAFASDTLASGTPLNPSASLPKNIYDPTSNPDNRPVAPPPPEPPPPEPPPPTLPKDGLSGYQGTFSAKSTLSGTLTDTGILTMGANWHNHKILGLMEGKDATGDVSLAFFIGTISDSGLTDVLLFGSDVSSRTNQVSFHQGTGTGSLSGEGFNLFNAKASGGDFSLTLAGTPLVDKWDVTLAGSHTAKDATEPLAPKGTSTWAGYAVGISENVAAPDRGRKIFMNDYADAAAEQFVLNINKDTGAIAGSLKAPQVYRLYNGGIDLTIGGGYGSAYVRDDILGALIGCTGNCVTDDTVVGAATSSVPLNRYGNFMMAAKPSEQFSEYVTWGYWETSHQEPNGDMYHTHAPYSMWIAGEKTPAAYVDNLINNRTTFVGVYNGIAKGTQIDLATNHASSLTNGSCYVEVDFGNANAANAVTGSLIFDQVTLAFTSPEFGLSSHGFKASIPAAVTLSGGTPSVATITDSAVNGSFYGPKADAIGGNFRATSSTTRYVGIFGGKLINGPAASRPR